MNTQIPQTDSIQVLAEFWDTHDLTDFEDELEEVNEPVFENGIVIQVHFQPEEVAAVKKLAIAQGLDLEELIRGWVLERMQSA